MEFLTQFLNAYITKTGVRIRIFWTKVAFYLIKQGLSIKLIVYTLEACYSETH